MFQIGAIFSVVTSGVSGLGKGFGMFNFFSEQRKKSAESVIRDDGPS